jgi:hypothetical protein
MPDINGAFCRGVRLYALSKVGNHKYRSFHKTVLVRLYDLCVHGSPSRERDFETSFFWEKVPPVGAVAMLLRLL